jgi:hypothetical protein
MADSPDTILSHLPTVLTFSTTLLVCFSVAYDAAYFWTLDAHLFTLLTISDHIASFIESLPIFAISVFSVVGLNLIENSFPHSKLFKPDSYPIASLLGWTIFLPWNKWQVFAILAVLILVVWVFVGAGFLFFLALPIMMLWQNLCAYSLPKMQPEIPYSLRSTIYFVPLLLFVALVAGYQTASYQVNDRQGAYMIITADFDTIWNANILRYGSFGVILRETAQEKIVVVPWSQIVSIQNRSPYDKTVACRVISALCFTPL